MAQYFKCMIYSMHHYNFMFLPFVWILFGTSLDFFFNLYVLFDFLSLSEEQTNNHPGPVRVTV